MRLLLLACTFFTFGNAWWQAPGDYVSTIEKLRRKGKLTTRRSTDKTFVGSVTGYYHNDSLVLVNSLTDAEEAGTETLYFIKDGVLKKVFILAATFKSNEKWKGYYSKHKSLDKCYSCHGKPDCIKTEITFGSKPKIVVTENKKIRVMTQGEKDKILKDVLETSEELKILLKDIK